MPNLDIEEGQGHLTVIIARLNLRDELIIAQDGEPVATLVRISPTQWLRKAGSAKHRILWIAPDFHAPLEDFVEYVE